MLENQITQVRIKNYRSIANVTVDLGPLTVLVGKNGSGKSNFVKALEFSYLCLLSPEDAVNKFHQDGGVSIVSHKKTSSFLSELINLGLNIKFRSEEGSIETFINTSENIENVEIEINDDDFLDLYYKPLRENPFRYFNAFPDTIIRQPQKITQDYYLEDDGSNLCVILLKMLEEDRHKPDIIFALSRVVKNIKDIRVTPLGRGYVIAELCHGMEDGTDIWLELWQESDGTLRMLWLLVAIYQDDSTGILAIEEPELFLHPGALGVLAEIIQEVSLRRQVIITTQSPDLISCFAADELQIVEMINGETKIGMLKESQREAINKELFSGGDLLRIEGLHSTSYEPRMVKAV
jgi:predicted ATPase